MTTAHSPTQSPSDTRVRKHATPTTQIQRSRSTWLGSTHLKTWASLTFRKKSCIFLNIRSLYSQGVLCYKALMFQKAQFVIWKEWPIGVFLAFTARSVQSNTQMPGSSRGNRLLARWDAEFPGDPCNELADDWGVCLFQKSKANSSVWTPTTGPYSHLFSLHALCPTLLATFLQGDEKEFLQTFPNPKSGRGSE